MLGPNLHRQSWSIFPKWVMLGTPATYRDSVCSAAEKWRRLEKAISAISPPRKWRHSRPLGLAKVPRGLSPATQSTTGGIPVPKLSGVSVSRWLVLWYCMDLRFTNCCQWWVPSALVNTCGAAWSASGTLADIISSAISHTVTCLALCSFTANYSPWQPSAFNHRRSCGLV